MRLKAHMRIGRADVCAGTRFRKLVDPGHGRCKIDPVDFRTEDGNPVHRLDLQLFFAHS